MSRKQNLRNYDTDNGTSRFDPKMDITVFPKSSDLSFGFKRPKTNRTRDLLEGPSRTEMGKNVISHASGGRNSVVLHRLNANEVANMSAVPQDVALEDKNKVKEVLKLFRDLHKELMDKYKSEQKQDDVKATRFDLKAAMLLKEKGKWINSDRQRFGQIPGIEIDDKFQFRAELAVVGLHCPYFGGIDWVKLDGEIFATSVVNSGRYENKAKTGDILIYSGAGGQMGNKADQKLKLGNLALANSMKRKYPVRVIRKTESRSCEFAYDGLYAVNKYWTDRVCGKLVFKFELHRILGQQKLTRKLALKECCVVDDLSHGKEVKFKIRAMNGIDDEKPEKFGYITKSLYPEWCKKIEKSGCNCINGCSNSGQCVCVMKNGSEIAYSEKGVLVKRKSVVYECGPFCKCPPTCLNRVSQHDPRYQLELYRTESRKWGVRSRSYISSGSFVCEYVGKWQKANDTNLEVNHCRNSRSDENETRFIIDTSKLGNVGRFIGFSSSPSLFVQRVLYDHDDERMPHIMLFAAKNIPPLHELTCDYDEMTSG